MNNNLREYRQLLKLSQAEFARELGVSQGSICLYEAGQTPTLSVLLALKTLIKKRLHLEIVLESIVREFTDS